MNTLYTQTHDTHATHTNIYIYHHTKTHLISLHTQHMPTIHTQTLSLLALPSLPLFPSFLPLSREKLKADTIKQITQDLKHYEPRAKVASVWAGGRGGI